MDKNLRKSYDCLDLPISASIEQVEAREKALIKIFQAKEKEENISCSKEINRVKISKKRIISSIQINGIPKEEEKHRFIASNESVFVLFLISICAGIFCYFTFTLFL